VRQDLVRHVTGREHELIQEIVRAVAERELLERHAELGRQRPTKCEATRVGIEVQLIQRTWERSKGLRRGAQRVLVGRDFDRTRDAKLALQLLDGLARLIDVQTTNVGRCKLFEPIHGTHRTTGMPRMATPVYSVSACVV
jgi:hypothetical protein